MTICAIREQHPTKKMLLNLSSSISSVARTKSFNAKKGIVPRSIVINVHLNKDVIPVPNAFTALRLCAERRPIVLTVLWHKVYVTSVRNNHVVYLVNSVVTIVKVVMTGRNDMKSNPVYPVVENGGLFSGVTIHKTNLEKKIL